MRTCKNAMNITEFVDSIKLQLTDFMDGFCVKLSNLFLTAHYLYVINRNCYSNDFW